MKSKKNSEIHTNDEVAEWLKNRTVIAEKQQLPCCPGEFAGRHEAIRCPDGLWVWAVDKEQDDQ